MLPHIPMTAIGNEMPTSQMNLNSGMFGPSYGLGGLDPEPKVLFQDSVAIIVILSVDTLTELS